MAEAYMPTVQPVKPPAISVLKKLRAIPHHSKCRYGERGATAAKPKAQIILDAAKVSAASAVSYTHLTLPTTERV